MKKNKLTILGSGSSSTIPSLPCVINNNMCKICYTLNEKPKNRRDNTSCLIYIDSLLEHFLFDFCVNMSIKFLQLDIKNIPVLILSHEHSDAMAGFIYLYPAIPKNTILPVYSTAKGVLELKSRYPYMFEKNKNDENLGFFELKSFEDFNRKYEKNIKLIEVVHGNTTCLGFKTKNLAYFADISSYECFKSDELQDLDVLIVECNQKEYKSFGHLNEKDVDNILEIVNPKRVVLTGLSHTMDYYCEDNKYEFGFDMMEIRF